MARSAAHKHHSTRRATYQDVLDAPAHQVAEIVNGTLYTHPRPAMPHALASSYLGDELTGPFGKGRGGPGGWWIIDEPELHCDDDIVVPDLAGLAPGADAGVSANRLRHPRARLGVRGAFRIDPQARPAREAPGLRPRRRRPHLWLVDPTDRTLEALELHDGQWLLIASAQDDEPVSIRPFDAITFSLGALWP